VQPIATDATHSVVCVLGTVVNCAKTAEAIELLFLLFVCYSGGPTECCITWRFVSPVGMGNFKSVMSGFSLHAGDLCSD